MEWLSPEQVLQQYGQPGMMLYGRAFLTDQQAWETAFYIREESRIIRRLGPIPRVELRTGLFVDQGVALIPLLVELSSWKETQRYECWLNAHQEGVDGFAYLNDLASQQRIAFFLYGDSGTLEHRFQIPNTVQRVFAEMSRQVRALPPWSMKAFDAAKEVLYRRYSPDALWQALKAL